MRSAIIAIVLLATTTAAMAEPEVRTERRRSHVVAAWALLGVGAASLATSFTLGYVADRRYEDATAKHCESIDGVFVCDATGYSQTKRAISLGNVGTGFAIAGWGLVASAAIVYFTAPRDRITVAPVATAAGGGLVLGGRF